MIVDRTSEYLLVLTALHVVDAAAREHDDIAVWLAGAPTERLRGRVHPEVDEDLDLALVRVDVGGSNRREPVVIADPGQLSDRESLVVLGHGPAPWRVRSVEVEAIDDAYIYFDRDVTPGDSGGAVFRSDGRLVGIVERKGRAIRIDRALRTLEAWDAEHNLVSRQTFCAALDEIVDGMMQHGRGLVGEPRTKTYANALDEWASVVQLPGAVDSFLFTKDRKGAFGRSVPVMFHQSRFTATDAQRMHCNLDRQIRECTHVVVTLGAEGMNERHVGDQGKTYRYLIEDVVGGLLYIERDEVILRLSAP